MIAVALLGAGCLPSPPLAGAGVADPFHVPPASAAALNAEALPFYRSGRWDEARARYRAAHAADPAFAAPLLNVACSFVRQDRFEEATAGVLALLEHGYVPWARQVREAADLGALKVRGDWARIEEALGRAASAWGEGLDESVLFVARRKVPVRIKGDGVLILALQQEIFAFLPTTGRYRQITSEDGRVLAWARSADGRRLLYATAEKVVRQGGLSVALRGVVLHTLELASMTPGPPASVPGDVRGLELAYPPTGAMVRVDSNRFEGTFAVQEGALVARRGRLRGATRLRPMGVAGPGVLALRGACRGAARDVAGEAATPEIEIVAAQRRLRVRAPAGAGLYGLPIPAE